MPCDQVGDARLQDLLGRQALHSGNRPSLSSVAGQVEGQQLAPNTVELGVAAIYDFTVVHRSGSANGNADCLSRTPWPDSSANEFAAGEGWRSVTDFTEVTSRNGDTSRNGGYEQGRQAIRYQNL